MISLNPQSLEAAARALASEHFGVEPDDVESYMKDNAEFESVSRFAARYQKPALAAITAFLSSQREMGYALVPREPTAEMIVSGVAERHGQPVPEAWTLATENIWRAMWDASPKQPGDT